VSQDAFGHAVTLNFDLLTPKSNIPAPLQGSTITYVSHVMRGIRLTLVRVTTLIMYAQRVFDAFDSSMFVIGLQCSAIKHSIVTIVNLISILLIKQTYSAQRWHYNIYKQIEQSPK